jgi:hypothetical protein
MRRAGLRRDATGYQVIDALEAQEIQEKRDIRRSAMKVKKISTAVAKQSKKRAMAC